MFEQLVLYVNRIQSRNKSLIGQRKLQYAFLSGSHIRFYVEKLSGAETCSHSVQFEFYHDTISYNII